MNMHAASAVQTPTACLLDEWMALLNPWIRVLAAESVPWLQPQAVLLFGFWFDMVCHCTYSGYACLLIYEDCSCLLLCPCGRVGQGGIACSSGAGCVGLIPANSIAQHVPSFSHWQFEMKLSPFAAAPFYTLAVLCFTLVPAQGG
jgi:hypothetical protein